MKSILVLLLSLYSAGLLAEELVEITTPRGVTQKFLLIKKERPMAALILFAGGKGALNLSSDPFGGTGIGLGKRNFLVRSRSQLSNSNLMVATVDAPSDHSGKQGMLGGFRSSPEHVVDIDAVIAYLRKIADVPVWLIGTSRGTESATNIAIHSQQHPHGLVLTSSMLVGDRKGKAVTDFNLSDITVPVLITHHKADGCPKTPPGLVQTIRDGLGNAPVVRVEWFDGGREKSKPCKAMSHHGYLGIEREVVDSIVTFMLGNS